MPKVTSLAYRLSVHLLKLFGTLPGSYRSPAGRCSQENLFSMKYCSLSDLPYFLQEAVFFHRRAAGWALSGVHVLEYLPVECSVQHCLHCDVRGCSVYPQSRAAKHSTPCSGCYVKVLLFSWLWYVSLHFAAMGVRGVPGSKKPGPSDLTTLRQCDCESGPRWRPRASQPCQHSLCTCILHHRYGWVVLVRKSRGLLQLSEGRLPLGEPQCLDLFYYNSLIFL